MFIYFRKDTGAFSHTSIVSNGGEWLHEFESADSDTSYTYHLVDGAPVKDTKLAPVEIIDDTAFNLSALRNLRNAKLAETDWSAGSDLQMSEEMRTYRKALRDITLTAKSVSEAIWPVCPL